jgi:hypothetical protein
MALNSEQFKSCSVTGQEQLHGLVQHVMIHHIWQLMHNYHPTVCTLSQNSNAERLLLVRSVHHPGVLIILLCWPFCCAATSSTYPLVLSEGWNTNLDFLQAHPPPFR